MVRFALLAALVMAAALPAAAAAPVQIPVGTWLDAAIASLLAAMGGAAGITAWALRKSKLPRAAQLLLQAARVEQLLARALDAARNRVRGIGRDGVVEVDTGLEVANEMLRYAVQMAPELVKEFGIIDMWNKVLARVPLAADAAFNRDVSPNLSDPIFAPYVPRL